MRDCEYCKGEGMDPYIDYLLPCPECDGSGGGLGYDEDECMVCGDDPELCYCTSERAQQKGE